MHEYLCKKVPYRYQTAFRNGKYLFIHKITVVKIKILKPYGFPLKNMYIGCYFSHVIRLKIFILHILKYFINLQYN